MIISMLNKILQVAERLASAQASNAETPRADLTIPPDPGFGVYSCRRTQKIRSMELRDATVLLVLKGRKEVATDSRAWVAQPGEMLLVPADSTIWLGNFPDAVQRSYHGLAVRFSFEVVEIFHRMYGSQDRPQGQGLWHAEAPPDFLAGLHQWLQWCAEHPPDSELTRHRMLELLLLIAQARLAGNLLLSRHPSWSRRVSNLFYSDPGRDWRMDEVTDRLAVSESTLRRHLQKDGKGFRALLEEARLAQGLTLIQESAWPIGRIADAVGYRSHSRFSERFKRRFGLTPQALRHTRLLEDPALQPGATA